MLPALLILAGVFVLIAFARIGAARRRVLLKRWPVVLLGGAAVFMALRGGYTAALMLALGAAAQWYWATQMAQPRPPRPQVDMGDAEARTILGVGPEATAEQIRAAYRAQMRRHHPDRGGAHDHAARLSAARDRLLKKG